MTLSKKPIMTEVGVVVEGTHQATGTGFPTANIAYTDADITGTYAGSVRVGEEEYHAAIYANQKRMVLEAYLFDFSGDLYGKQITMILWERMAEDQTFQGLQDEKSFIDWAVKEVEQYFNREE
jgi:riboflavin kinase/FMN adenylyltransferase